MISFSSSRLMAESTHRDIIRIMKSYFLDLASIASEKALRKPAIGALILSSLHPIRRNRHKNSL